MKRLVQLVTGNEAKPFQRQHKAPCSDCPWARHSLAGWTGDTTTTDWIDAAHSESRMECHTRVMSDKQRTPYQCAGAAIYRANVAKVVRWPLALVLPANHSKVFSSPEEFRKHHGR